MNVLVTGGAGYIGSVVAQQLIEAGHQVTIVDNLLKGHRAAVPAQADLLIADLADRTAIDSLFAAKPIDAVMHLAAFIEAGESMQSPEKYFRNNSANTLNLIE
ncbi:MAG: NAD-dependent epimerase/dehydratase family protein, partial [Acidobacteriia bacterium]|nr:NAD-dependent epimerase/dehydratase family protein [Terriglobia bacterium]